MPYPAAREHPETTPCIKKLRGNSDGVIETEKNSDPRRRPQLENECHCTLPIRPHLSTSAARFARTCRRASVLPAQACCPAPPRFMIHDYSRRGCASASRSPGECGQRIKSKDARRRERPTLRSRGCCLAVRYNGAPHSAFGNRTPQTVPGSADCRCLFIRG